MSEWSGAILKSFTFFTTLDKIGDSYPYLVGNSHTPLPPPSTPECVQKWADSLSKIVPEWWKISEQMTFRNFRDETIILPWNNKHPAR